MWSVSLPVLDRGKSHLVCVRKFIGSIASLPAVWAFFVHQACLARPVKVTAGEVDSSFAQPEYRCVRIVVVDTKRVGDLIVGVPTRIGRTEGVGDAGVLLAARCQVGSRSCRFIQHLPNRLKQPSARSLPNHPNQSFDFGPWRLALSTSNDRRRFSFDLSGEDGASVEFVGEEGQQRDIESLVGEELGHAGGGRIGAHADKDELWRELVGEVCVGVLFGVPVVEAVDPFDVALAGGCGDALREFIDAEFGEGGGIIDDLGHCVARELVALELEEDESPVGVDAEQVKRSGASFELSSDELESGHEQVGLLGEGVFEIAFGADARRRFEFVEFAVVGAGPEFDLVHYVPDSVRIGLSRDG